MRKLIRVGAVAATTLSVALAGTSLAQTANGASHTQARPAAASSSYTPPAINWGTCADDTLASGGAQCGYLIVPLNYAHPHGTKIKIAVSKVDHTGPVDKGPMLVNPGGPGGSGLIYSLLPQFYTIPNHAGDAYDWIGFDPRGVGSSIPSISCNKNFFHGDRPPYKPTTKKIMTEWVNRSKAYAADCAHSKGAALLKHVKTVDSVRDMESLRKALGASKINFYGFSYGTYLGSVYAQLHPSRVGRFVLDSTVDPRRVFYKSNLDQDVAFQKTFTIYFKWIAKYHSVYHVGASLKTVRKTFLATEAKLNKHAVKGILGGDELLDVFTSAGYYVYGWEDIAAAYSKYLHGHGAGALIKMYTDANPTTKGGDNSYAMYIATQCTDAAWPRSQAKLNQDSRKYNKKNYYFTWANAWFNGPCAYWHYKAGTPVHITGKGVNAKILMIDETYDPATPYAGSLYVRKLFKHASLIEGKNGTTHAGSLSGVACTDDAIGAYLTDGTLPARKAGNRSDKVCPPVPKPNPLAPSTSRTVSSSAAVAARAKLSGGLLAAWRP